MFAPFARGQAKAAADKPASSGGGDIDELKHQLEEMQKRIDRLTVKE